MHGFSKLGLALAVLTQLLSVRVSATEVGALKAGAARVEITPDANAIPRPFTSILDPLYARAIYLENGHDRTVLLNADVGAISTAITDKVAAEILQELNVPVANILISATHDHSAIFGGPRPPGPALPHRRTLRQERLKTSWFRDWNRPRSKPTTRCSRPKSVTERAACT